MKISRFLCSALLLTFACRALAATHDQKPQPNPLHLPSVFVMPKASFSAVAIPLAIGPAPFVLESEGSSAFDVNQFLRKRCHVAVTAATQETADYVLTPADSKPGKGLFSTTPNNKEWDLKDKTGKTVFSTSAWREVNTAKDVCDYFKAHP